jgi:hypothetical protein
VCSVSVCMESPRSEISLENCMKRAEKYARHVESWKDNYEGEERS